MSKISTKLKLGALKSTVVTKSALYLSLRYTAETLIDFCNQHYFEIDEVGEINHILTTIMRLDLLSGDYCTEELSADKKFAKKLRNLVKYVGDKMFDKYHKSHIN